MENSFDSTSENARCDEEVLIFEAFEYKLKTFKMTCEKLISLRAFDGKFSKSFARVRSYFFQKKFCYRFLLDNL